jgi:hypothetical protein
MSILENTYSIESNLYDFYRTVSRFSKRTFYTDRHISWVNCAPSPWPCGIFDANLNTKDIKESIVSIKNQMVRGITPKVWMTGPSMHPSNLDEQLVKNGFVKQSELTGMALEFSHLKSDFERTPGLDIQIVTDEKNLRDWASVAAPGLFGDSDKNATSFQELMATVLPCDMVTLFIGYLENRPVGSSTLFVSNGIAGVYHIATAAPFRKKGIGRSMALVPLLQARELGARFAVVQATKPVKGIFDLLGFTEYCTLSSFVVKV